MRLSPFRILALLSFGLLFSSPAAGKNSADVLVYDATPGGIAAAVGAAKSGQSVLLLESTDRIGGLVTSGLSNTDFRSFESLTGFFLDFANRVEADYREQYGDDSPQVKASFRGTHGEPGVNLRILEEMIAEHPEIRVVKNAMIDSVETGPFVRGRREILSLRTRGGEIYEAEMFIDASYEGDLMALAGENYHVGRESRTHYGEAKAGDKNGNADGQVQGYNYRLIMTQVPENRVPAPQPDGYRREDFTGALRHFREGTVKQVFSSGHDGIYRAHLPLLPNGKADVNDAPRVPIRLSMPDINDDYPDADFETREEIIQQHFYYNIGLLYFLQNDEEVPGAIQEEARSWGFCQDEFEETNHIPPRLYIREARRLVGQHVFTGSDTKQLADDARNAHQPLSIAMGDYIHNCHGTGRIGTRFDGVHSGEFYEKIPPFQIAYGVIVPKATGNLLVPVACSASHFGFATLRLEPIWASLGQAAGWAAGLALDGEVPVMDVDVHQLQERLHADGSATIYVGDVPPSSPDFAAVQWLGSLGGLHGLAEANQPSPEKIVGQYNEAFPGHGIHLDQKLGPELRKRWSEITGFTGGDNAATRGEWVRLAFVSREG